MSDGRDFLPPDVKALVDAERHRFAIPDEARDRLLSKLVAGAPALGHGGHGAGPSAPPAGAAPVASGASASSTLLGATAVKLLVALSVVGAATVFVETRSSTRAPAVRVAASSPSPLAAVATVDPPLPAPPAVSEVPPPVLASREVVSPRPVAPAREAPHASSAPASAPPPDETREESAGLAEERRLLDAARASIVAGSPEAAVPVLASCAVRFPDGPLTEERLALQIRALARTGRGDEARALLATMRATYPHSFVLQGAVDDVARIP